MVQRVFRLVQIQQTGAMPESSEADCQQGECGAEPTGLNPAFHASQAKHCPPELSVLLGATGQISLLFWGMGSAQVCCIFLSAGLMKELNPSLSFLLVAQPSCCAPVVFPCWDHTDSTPSTNAAEGIALSITPHALILHQFYMAGGFISSEQKRVQFASWCRGEMVGASVVSSLGPVVSLPYTTSSLFTHHEKGTFKTSKQMSITNRLEKLAFPKIYSHLASVKYRFVSF